MADRPTGRSRCNYLPHAPVGAKGDRDRLQTSPPERRRSRIWLPLLVGAVVSMAAAAAGAAGFFDEDQAIPQAVAQIKEKIGGGHLRALRVSITADEVAVEVQNPQDRRHIDEWRFGRAKAEGRLGLILRLMPWQGVTGPRPVQPQLVNKDLEANLFDLDGIDFGAAGKLAKAAIARAALDDPAQVTGMEIARQVLILRARSGDVRWTVEVSSGREAAQIHADGHGGIVGADLGGTNRQKNLDLFRRLELLADFARDFRDALGTGKVLTGISISRDSVYFTTNLADTAASLGTNIAGLWNLSGLQKNVVGTPKLPFRCEDAFGISEVDWGILPKLPETARQALGMPRGRTAGIGLSKPMQGVGPSVVLWNIELADENGEKGSVLADAAGAVRLVRLPASRRRPSDWFYPPTIAEVLSRIDREFGAGWKFWHVMFYPGNVAIKAQDPREPAKLMDFLLTDDGVSRSFGCGPGPPVSPMPGEHPFTIAELVQLGPGRLADLEKQTLARLDLPGIEISRVTIAHNFFDPSPKGNVTLEIRAEVPPFNAPSPPGGRVVYELDGTVIKSYLPERSAADLMTKAMRADARHDYAEALRWYYEAKSQFVHDNPAFGNWVYDYTAALRTAVEQGLAGAQYETGFLYMRGQGVARDDAEALRRFGEAADQGVAQAQFWIGAFYTFGRGVTKTRRRRYAGIARRRSMACAKPNYTSRSLTRTATAWRRTTRRRCAGTARQRTKVSPPPNMLWGSCMRTASGWREIEARRGSGWKRPRPAGSRTRTGGLRRTDGPTAARR